MRHYSRLAMVILLLVGAGCAKAPPSLSPAGVADYRANEAIVAVGTLQHTAIALNKVQVCPSAPATTPACHPLISDKDTAIVVDASTAAITVIVASPDGWKAATNTALDQINRELSTLGKSKLTIYVEAARSVINTIGGTQ